MRSLKLYFILLFGAGLFGCHHASSTVSFVPGPLKVYADSVKNLDKVIQGDWSNLRDTSLLFSIDKDAIFYQVANASYPYQLKHDSITIKFDDDVYHARMKMLSKDTLVMIGTGKDKGNIDSVYRNVSPNE
jgi:hypothetical protein